MPAGYGGLYAAMGVGSLAGSLTLAFMSSRRAIPLMLGGGLVFSTPLVGIAATQNVWVAAALILGAGYSSMLMINTINATVQANTPDALRGRVMSFYVTVFAGSAPLGGLFAGAVAEAWGVPAAFLAGAALSFLTLGVVALGLRAARRRGQLGVTSLDGSTARSRAPGDTGGARRLSGALSGRGAAPGAPRAPWRRPRAGLRGAAPAARGRPRAGPGASPAPVDVPVSVRARITARRSLGSSWRSTSPASASAAARRVTTGAVTTRCRATSACGCGPVVSIRRMTLYCW